MKGGRRTAPKGWQRSSLRWTFTALAATLLTVGCGSSGGSGNPPEQDAASTKRGYVLSSFSYMFPEHDDNPCPGGFTKGPIEMQLEDGTVLPDNCLDPESVSDPGFKTLDGPGRFDGFDLDGHVSTQAAPVA